MYNDFPVPILTVIGLTYSRMTKIFYVVFLILILILN